MPVQTRRKTVTFAEEVQETGKLPLIREQKKQLRQEMKMKEREDKQRESAKKFSEGVHKALLGRTQFLIDNGYVNSPIFECLREAKSNLTGSEFYYLILFIRHIPSYQHSRELAISGISWALDVRKNKLNNVCVWLRKFMSIVSEGNVWTQNEHTTKVSWTRIDDAVIAHNDIMFVTWDFYKHHFTKFPDCIEF